jgi:hypothetical protein
METFISGNKLLKLFFLPAIFLITICLTGCNGQYVYSDENYDDPVYDTGDDDEPDYPEPPDYGGYEDPDSSVTLDSVVNHKPDNEAPRDSAGYHIIWIGYWKIALEPCSIVGNNNSLKKADASEVKYYEVEESYTSDFSGSNKMYKLHRDYFKPNIKSQLKRYDRVRAVCANSKSAWSNVIFIK